MIYAMLGINQSLSPIYSSIFIETVNLCSVSLPGNTPVRLDLEDGRIICVVELDLWVPQLSRVDVHHDWGGSWDLSCGGDTYHLLATPPGRVGHEGRKILHRELNVGLS